MQTKTLLLTSWYLPTRVLSWQDAVKMVYEGRVDVLATYDEELRSPSVTWRTPAVVRLRRASPLRKHGVRFSRMNVYLRDGFRCQYCARQLPLRELTLDHLVPKSKGGQKVFENIVSACRPCNSRKANLTCDQAGMYPLQSPFRPSSLPVKRALTGPEAAPEEWAPFLGAPWPL